jgi:hypothetical protein
MPLFGFRDETIYLIIQIIREIKLTSGQKLQTSDDKIGEIDSRILAGYQWLKSAYLATHGNGFSKGYSYFSGWMPAYPETSGYIISTLIKYHRIYQDDESLQLARSTGEWLFTKHNSDGGIPAIKERPSNSLAFDTGMVLQGYTDLYSETGEEAFGKYASLCVDFLCKTQNENGSWSNCYFNIPHAYHARVSWPLMIYAKTFLDDKALVSAGKNLDWVVSQQNDVGYWQSANFSPKMPYANTHSLGYILEGLIESYLLTGKNEWLESARKGADRLADFAILHRGYLPSYFNSEWQEQKVVPFSFACLTGIAQISRAWLLLNKITNEKKYLEAGHLGLDYVIQYQDITTHLDSIRGALPGSAPIFGRYLPFQFPNWAVKFLLDLFFEKKHTQ